MLTITRIESQYPAPDDEEADYCPEPVSTSTHESVTFRELVTLMQAHPHPSCYPARGEVFEWLSAETEQDFITGEFTEASLHYGRDNPPGRAKYWRAAMRAAGILKGPKP
jgi:hypothetical protein